MDLASILSDVSMAEMLSALIVPIVTYTLKLLFKPSQKDIMAVSKTLALMIVGITRIIKWFHREEEHIKEMAHDIIHEVEDFITGLRNAKIGLG